MPRQIQGSQRDFSFGEVDVALKRNDDHPARKGGLRQMANARLLNAGGLQDRPGRRALYPITNSGLRTERFTISPGNVFDIQFAAGRLKIIDSTGTTVLNQTTQGNGAGLPWASAADIQSIVYVLHQSFKQIYITFGHAMRPQIISWDGAATWSIADFTELVIGNQKRTFFYRISPQGITLQPGATSGIGVSLLASSALFVAGHVGTRMRYIGRQILITAVTDSTHATITVEEPLPPSQVLTFTVDPRTTFSVGDVVIGSSTDTEAQIISLTSTQATVQLLSSSSASITSGGTGGGSSSSTAGFTTSDIVAGPSGAQVPTAVSAIGAPFAVTSWDEEVMNGLQGYPASVFVDQFRVGFCDFPTVPGGIGWSAINSPTDLYVGALPAAAFFEIASGKARVLHVVPGPESNEFVFTDSRVYYIPISPTNPLKPGSVQFLLLTGDGAAQVQPRISQEAILYVNAGQNSVMAVIATGAYLRPFNTKNLTEFHAHLFNNIQCIAAPSADGTFNERYAYVLNGDGSIAVGKYNPESLQTNLPVIGWGPWSGEGGVQWIAAHRSDVVFTSIHQGVQMVEILDDTMYLDAAIFVNNLPAAFTPPDGKGPLWFMPSTAVDLIDQNTRAMGTYQIDANGFIVPQNRGGEDLTLASLVAGQRWTMTVEPFAPIAQPGADMRQRVTMRAISTFAVYVINSSGFLFNALFSSKQTPTSPPLGAIVGSRRVPAWNVGDNPLLPPPLRETVEIYSPTGSSFDPRVAIVKDTPGPFQLLEIAVEVSI